MSKLVCENCGGTNIQTRAWIDANTNEITDADGGGDRDDNWCEDCEQHLLFVDENDFVNT